MAWKIMIVDDEQPAREELAYMLDLESMKAASGADLEVVAQASSGMEAVKKAKETAPDLIFLDIELPDLTGMQVAELLAELGLEAKIVFVTAYDQYAVEAFKLRAFHYIRKPYDEDDLAFVFREISKNRRVQAYAVQTQAISQVKLPIEMDGTIKYFLPKDIVYISKEGKVLLVHTKDKKYEANYTLQDLENKLTPYSFFRAHKSYLVNLEHVVELQAWVNGAYNLHMDDICQSMVPVSRNYVKELRFKLEI